MLSRCDRQSYTPSSKRPAELAQIVRRQVGLVVHAHVEWGVSLLGQGRPEGEVPDGQDGAVVSLDILIEALVMPAMELGHGEYAGERPQAVLDVSVLEEEVERDRRASGGTTALEHGTGAVSASPRSAMGPTGAR